MIQVYHDHIRDALRELSSIRMQKRLWLNTGEPEWSSLEEAMCRLFNDSGLEIALDRGETSFGAGVNAGFRKLGRILQSVDTRRHPRDIINDPAMMNVRTMAAQLLKDAYDEEVNCDQG